MAESNRSGQPNPFPERSGTLIEGPATGEHSGTIIETDDDIRQALLSGLKGPPQSTPAQQAPPPVSPAPQPTGRLATPYRPTVRPGIAVLTVCDDGKLEGETIRIRDHRFVIGRTEGDLTIPIDGRMSSRHVEITHQVVGGIHRWVVTDLQSTHGMFVRVTKTPLADKAEFLVGNGRYRLDIPQQDTGATVDNLGSHGGRSETQGWNDESSQFRPPALTELLGKEIGNRTLLIKPEYWIGSDPTCPICRPDDPFCEPRHARVFLGQKGSWHAEHNKAQNGLWLRMSQVPATTLVWFQIGEQRFRLNVS